MDNIGDTIEISAEKFKKILDHSSDEIFVIDDQKKIIYVNKLCEKHYGLKPSEVIGEYNMSLFEKEYWRPSIVPLVFEKMEPITIKQTTYIGTELITTAIPIINEQNKIELVVITAQELQNLTSLKEYNENNDSDTNAFPQQALFTNSEKMKHIIKFCKKIAKVDSTVLIQGDSGTGKGVLASYIHQISDRKDGPFLTINCAAIPENLLESELFGYAKGSFTGANANGKHGLVEEAEGGTLFLDEIGELSLKIQAKILHLIQEHEFIPIGGRKPKKVDIRIIAATNRHLIDMVKNKEFREDLFYRLNVIDIKLPPLKERTEDIIPLTYYFLNKFNNKFSVNRTISQECLDIIANYSWPGNIRQLENVIERLVITSDSVIYADDLPEVIFQNTKNKSLYLTHSSLDSAIKEIEKEFIRKSFKKLKSSRKVAKELNISQTRANNLIREYCEDLKEN
ncbi:sigma-54 interaction domain-containing protein [Scopulibacillus cellulosilyticus]|uniref:Sigma-54 interaction domain-containing protein n=1 Tax=Scopulibacillus cellulosilyticus TaxID=2665665 RepID=A0ABW2PU34_9BACL